VAGYAYVGVNVRGTGCSEGVFSYYQPIEAQDGAEVVEWIAAQPWSTGDVGMIGASYGGHTQIKVAALRPPHLKAIVPVSTEGNEYRDEGMAGGMFNAGLMGEWTFRIQPSLAQAGAEARIRAGDTECAAIRANQPPNDAYAEVLQHPLYDEWWHARSLDTMAGAVTVPTLLIHAWQDEWIRPNGAIRLFNLLGSDSKRLILQNGMHALRALHVNRAAELQWLDRWVKGEDNGVDDEQPVAVLWEVAAQDGDRAGAKPSWTTAYPAWPPPSVEWFPLYLTATGELSSEVQSADPEQDSSSYLYPLGTELVGNSQQFALRPCPLGTLNYQTPVMTEDTVVLGAPELTLYLSCESSDSDLMFTLKDIDPVGNTLFLQRSVLRASMRLVDEAETMPQEIIQAFTATDELVPHEVYEIKLSLSAIGHVIREGHRLELSILAPCAIPDPIWGFAPVSQPSVNKVFHSKRHPSRFLLPVLPGEKAHAPAPTLGTLENQPFRPSLRPDSSTSEVGAHDDLN
jgi:putative CocE/NonD family hydrolase